MWSKVAGQELYVLGWVMKEDFLRRHLFMKKQTPPWIKWSQRKWQPTPVFLPGKSQGWGSLVGCHLWGHAELDTTERLNNNNNPYQCGLGIHIHVLLQKYYMFHYGVLPQIPLEEWSITHVWFYSLSKVLQILNSETYLAPSKVWIRDWGPV